MKNLKRIFKRIEIKLNQDKGDFFIDIYESNFFFFIYQFKNFNNFKFKYNFCKFYVNI